MTTAAPVRTLAPQPPPSDPVPPSARRSDGLALAVLAGITVVVAWNRLAFDSWLTRFDLFTFFLPWYTFLGERLRDLAVPGWNPHLFSGTPFAADPESGWMYLPAMLFFSLLAPLAAFKGLVAFQLAVAALSTYVFARVLGMGAMASLVAAVVYLTGPFLHWNTYCCLIFGQFGAWIPLALLGIELSLRGARRRDRMAAWFLGGFAVSQMLAGWIGEGWLYAMLLPAAYIGLSRAHLPAAECDLYSQGAPDGLRDDRDRCARVWVGARRGRYAAAIRRQRGDESRRRQLRRTRRRRSAQPAMDAGLSARPDRRSRQRLSLPGGVPGRRGRDPRAVGIANGAAAVRGPLLRHADPCRHDPDARHDAAAPALLL